MPLANTYCACVAAALLVCVAFATSSAAQGTTGPNVVILLRLAGDSPALSNFRSCLTSKLSQMPDIEIVSSPTDGVRFVLDIVAAKNASERLSASLVVAETFPIEQFRLRVREGEDSDALLTSIGNYILLRLHEVVPGRSYQNLCASIVSEFGNKVLAKEYTERND